MLQWNAGANGISAEGSGEPDAKRHRASPEKEAAVPNGNATQTEAAADDALDIGSAEKAADQVRFLHPRDLLAVLHAIMEALLLMIRIVANLSDLTISMHPASWPWSERLINLAALLSRPAMDSAIQNMCIPVTPGFCREFSVCLTR